MYLGILDLILLILGGILIGMGIILIRLCPAIKMKIVDQFFISGIGKVYMVEFAKPETRKAVSTLKGRYIKGKKIIGIEMHATGEGCLHKNAGLLVRE